VKLDLHTGAQDDLQEAVSWYSERDEDVAHAFLESVDFVLRSLQSYPLRWPLHPQLGVRRVSLTRFPYSILYDRVDERRVLVFAVAHHKRSPEYWLDRRESVR